MEQADVQKLAQLARIAVSDTEAEQFTSEIDSILAYVGEVSEVAAEEGVAPMVGAVHNIFRADEVTNEPNQYTDVIMKEMPETEGRFMKVKKILQQDD